MTRIVSNIIMMIFIVKTSMKKKNSQLLENIKYFSNRYQGTFLGENEEMAEHCSDDSGRQEIK